MLPNLYIWQITNYKGNFALIIGFIRKKIYLLFVSNNKRN